jgi:hypothetical protein
MMKTGHVEKTNDRDYEVEERRFRTMEAASLRLQKEAKGYLDSLRGGHFIRSPGLFKTVEPLGAC